MSNAIETIALTRTFGQRTAVEQLNLQIPAGAVFGFLGPNGAGKTTTVRMLAGLIAPTSGSASVAGFRLGSDDHAIRQRVGLLTETPGLYDRLTALQNLVFFGKLYGLDVARAHQQARHYLDMLGLGQRADEIVGGFSKGMRQKLAIARALMHEPEIVFLDEPTAGLDPEAALVVREFIQTLRSSGRTIFLTTHNLPEADQLCDLVAIFRTRLLEVGTPDALRTRLFGHGTRIRLAGPVEPLLRVAQMLPFVNAARVEGDQLLVTLDKPDESNPQLVRSLVEAGAAIRSVEPISASLEHIYLELIQQ